MKIPSRKLMLSMLVIASAFFSILYFSCNTDKCKTVVCAHGGVCSQGACTCPAGYEGSNCETVSRDKFLGAWSVFEKGSSTDAAQYPIGIHPSNNITDVVITNFYNYFQTPIKGYVVDDTLYIPNQQYEGKVVVGKGYILPNSTYGQYAQITVRYEVIDTATQRVDDFGVYGPDLSAPSQWNK